MKAPRIGTRGSALALWQANFVREQFEAQFGLKSEIVIIKTSGDRLEDAAIGEMGLKGVFIKELEDALLDGRVDLAVHSMKDVPTELPAGLQISAITKRTDARDCIISRAGETLEKLRPGARVGTSSLRRQAQLRYWRRDLDVRDLRGNVDTRVRKLDEGEFDAIVLAKAGLDRLGLAARVTQVLEPEVMLPAVGQGALGIETRAEDADTIGLLRDLDDEETRHCVDAERALLAGLQGGCQIPLGTWTRIAGRELRIEAAVLSVDGVECVRGDACGSASRAREVGLGLSRRLLSAGADKILQLAGRETRGTSP
ncbi:MAG TPA: hydroxymethylbilane synthase [Candidatus Acidoferrales bacterium]|nr:hydroxymethylbilane synthase [Candidatus Acidoferrales bacterium]